MADIILTPLPGTPALSPIAEAPCDFHSPNFFVARQHLIRPRLDAIRASSSSSSSSSSALPDVQSCAAHVGNDTQATPQETAAGSKRLEEGMANGGGGDECAGAGTHMVSPQGGDGTGQAAGVTAICICIHTYIHTYTYIHTSIRVCVCVCMCVCVCVYRKLSRLM